MRFLTTALLLAACGSAQPERLRLATTDPDPGGATTIDTRRGFERAVVGHHLQGENMDIVIAEGGIMTGTYLGRPITGTWRFRGGRFCYALADRVTQRNARCFRAAVAGREVRLLPVAD